MERITAIIIVFCILLTMLPISAIADTVVYPTVDVVFEGINTTNETAFSEWAASVISDYQNYYTHDSKYGVALYYDYYEASKLIPSYDLTHAIKTTDWNRWGGGGFRVNTYNSLGYVPTVNDKDDWQKMMR